MGIAIAVGIILPESVDLLAVDAYTMRIECCESIFTGIEI